MLAEERYWTILEVLKRDGCVKVSDLMRTFHVSIETVRRDLEHMEKVGLLKRVHGGAVLDRMNSVYQTAQTREKENTLQKKEIGQAVLQFVREGQTLAMDSSTTNCEAARALKTRFQRLTVLTNYLPIINELREMEKYTIIIPGGVIQNEELAMIGDMAEENTGKFHVDTAFVSMSGISLKNGLTDYGFGEIRMKRKMMEVARETVVLADSSKFGEASLLKVCNLTDVSCIITDSGLHESTAAKYRQAGVRVVRGLSENPEDWGNSGNRRIGASGNR